MAELAIDFSKVDKTIGGATGSADKAYTIPSGLQQSFEELFKRGDEAFARASKEHAQRMEAIGALDVQNRETAAELAFERWQSQALYGKDGNTATTSVDAYDKEKDPLKRATGLNGLQNARGMEAVGAAQMYAESSEVAINDLLASLPPASRQKMAARFRSKQMSTQNALNRRSEEARFKHQIETQKTLIAKSSKENASKYYTGIDTVNREMDAQVAAVREEYAKKRRMLESDRADLTSLIKDGAVDKNNANAGITVINSKLEVLKGEETEKLAGIEAARGVKLATELANYQANSTELEQKSVDFYLAQKGKKLEDLTPEENEALQFQMALFREENGTEFIKTMVDTGRYDEAEELLTDSTQYTKLGITDPRVADALLKQVKTKQGVERKKHDDSVKLAELYVSEALRVNAEGTGYVVTDEQLVGYYNAFLKAGQIEAATKISDVINKRREGIVTLENQKYNEEKRMKQLKEDGEEEKLAKISKIARLKLADLSTQNLDHGVSLTIKNTKGEDEDIFVPRGAYVDYLIMLAQPETEDERKRLEETYKRKNTEGVQSIQRALGKYKSGSTTTVLNEKTGKMETRIYPMSQNPNNADAGETNFNALFITINGGEDFKAVNPNNSKLYVWENGRSVLIDDATAAHLLNEVADAMDAYIAAYPTSTMHERDEIAAGLLNMVFNGTDLGAKYTGDITDTTNATLLPQRQENVRLQTNEWLRLANEDIAYLRTVDDGLGGLNADAVVSTLRSIKKGEAKESDRLTPPQNSDAKTHYSRERYQSIIDNNPFGSM